MKILGIQGSPRKNGNTAELIEEVLRGAEVSGAETELIHLVDIDMKGCRGCYGCKMNGDNYGKCVYKDGMQDLYKKIEECDAIVLGSPIYFCAITPELKAFIDRLFPYLTNDTLRGKKSALVFTQNQVNPHLFDWHFDANARCLSYVGFEFPEILLSVDTFGNEIGKDVCLPLKSLHPRKFKHREKEFPRDLEKAYEMGKNLVQIDN